MKQADIDRENRKSILMWAVLVAFLVIGLGSIVYFGSRPPEDQPVLLVDKTSPTDHIKGSPDAKVVIVEYGDYECPACAVYSQMVEQVVSEYGDRIAFVYRHFPLRQIHMNADISAQAAEAAGRQGKFWEMHAKLYSTQKEWESLRNAEIKFLDFARDLGLNESKFLSDMKSDEVRNVVQNNYLSANNLGLNGTPTFFLNGEKVQNPPGLEAFKSLIESKLNQ